MIACIVCMSPNGVIGKDGVMPWHDPQELHYFKEQTMGKDILMGSVTYAHLPNPLPGRKIHVLTRRKNIIQKEAITLWSEKAAVLDRWKDSDDILMVCGGASIYEQFLPYAKRLYLSILKTNYEGDRFFPAFDEEMWELIEKRQYETFDAYQLQRKTK